MTKRWVGLLAALWAIPALAAYDGSPPLIVANGGTGAITLTVHGVLIGEGTGAIVATAAGTSGIPLVGQGAADPIFGTAVVAGGGTGAVTLAANGVLVGEGTSAVHVVGSAATADSVVAWAAAGADPAALAVNNCATALTYSTSTHTFGCNASVGSVPSVLLYTTTNATVTMGTTNLETQAFNQSGTKATVIQLPTTPTANLRKCIKDDGNDFLANPVTVKHATGTIDGVAGATGKVMNQTYQEWCFIADGTNWHIE
jgi:hypothetical protein